MHKFLKRWSPFRKMEVGWSPMTTYMKVSVGVRRVAVLVGIWKTMLRKIHKFLKQKFPSRKWRWGRIQQRHIGKCQLGSNGCLQSLELKNSITEAQNSQVSEVMVTIEENGCGAKPRMTHQKPHLEFDGCPQPLEPKKSYRRGTKSTSSWRDSLRWGKWRWGRAQ